MPAQRGDDLWIIKIPQADMPLLPQIECVTMQWARAAGLTVPDCEIVAASQLVGMDAFVRQGVADVFAIRRYDRSADGIRTHQEDFAQVLNLMPRHKYGDSGPLRASLVGVGRIIRDAAADGAVEDFLSRVAFVIASGNTDAHLKNWSFVYHGNDVIPSMAPQEARLAPSRCGSSDNS
ncbi:MAG: HipA domain-containing protein [Deltaproteobacteria bacterium]|nr:HipA domain-containing protein [Deltaproteobacteria bacterium]